MFPVVVERSGIVPSARATTAFEPGNAARDFPAPPVPQCGPMPAIQASSEKVAKASTVDSTTARVTRLLSAP